jgi:abortive infection bacteriophage resistance protein
MRLFLAKFEERKQEINPYFEFVRVTEINIDEKRYLLTAEENAFKLAEKYGFSVPERCDELLKIKHIRNQLAHGEILFSEAGAISMIELMTMKKKSF